MLPLNLHMSKYCFASVNKKNKREMHPRMKRAQTEGEKGAKAPLLCAAACVLCVCCTSVCTCACLCVYIGACTLQSRDRSSKRRRLCSVLEPNKKKKTTTKQSHVWGQASKLHLKFTSSLQHQRRNFSFHSRFKVPITACFLFLGPKVT